MKAEELMLNDFVKHNDKVVQIAQINKFMADNLQPIPLTAEIMEKNGFILVEVGDNGVNTPKKNINRWEKWQCDSKWHTFTLIYDKMTERWKFYYNFNGFSFKYVHELQHALRLCGLNEEADNFKI